ncbi:MAG: helix-turn-helix domain-containing protein [Candidatus Nanopelagicales bacterium]
MRGDRSMEDAATPRDELMDTAERLIAERGLSVSLREIGAAAGHRNNSSVIYHFGNYDGLIAATLERRMAPLEDRRLTMLADLDRQGTYSLGDLLAVIVEPALEIPYAGGATHYARFVEQVRTHRVISDAVPGAEKCPAMRLTVDRLRRQLANLDRTAQNRRITLMASAMFAMMADYERDGELTTSRRQRRAGRELISILTAVLQVPEGPKSP